MLTVVTPATAFRLTTVERARVLLGFGNGEDAAVQRLIDQASRTIAEFCRRPFGVETVRETFGGCDIKGDGALLSRSPVTAFGPVLADGATLLTTEYQHDRESNRLYRVDASGWRWPWWSGSGLTVEYTAGYTLPADSGSWTLPESVERAAIMLVGAYLSTRAKDPLVRTEDVAGVGSTTWWVPGANDNLLSPEAEQLLQPYRRLFA